MIRRPILEVDHSGSLLLDLLVELGHIDDEILTRINDRLLDLQPADNRIPFQEVRRVAASVLFEQQDRRDDEARRALDAEWGLLFY